MDKRLTGLAILGLLSACFNQGTCQESRGCTDSKGDLVLADQFFHPLGQDPCLSCRCNPEMFHLLGGFVHGEFTCLMVQCSRPVCDRFEQIVGECCAYKCLEEEEEESELPARLEPERIVRPTVHEPTIIPEYSEPLVKEPGLSRSLNALLNPCCQMGQEWYLQSREQCSPNPPNIRDVETAEKDTCSAIADVCCIAEREKKQCYSGKQQARIWKTCDIQSYEYQGNELARKCCQCCMLGLTANSSGASCYAIQTVDSTCQQTFRECCTAESQPPTTSTARPRVPVAPTITTTSRPTTTTTVSVAIPTERQKLSGLCSRFEGQLCAHVCTDTVVSYKCSCRDGFVLAGDGRTCRQQRVQNRCNVYNPCEQLCEDTGLEVICKCFDGFLLMENGQFCQDIDECAEGAHKCTDAQTCVNTEGSYTCVGPSRPPVEPENKCDRGYAFNSITLQCEDIDECIINPHTCGVGLVCLNEPGTYRCIPESVGDQSKLGDDYHGDNQDPGNYEDDTVLVDEMTCGTGYQYSRDTHRCEDIDECDLGVHRCIGASWACTNTKGSYKCAGDMCPAGYSYDTSTASCQDINECALSLDICVTGQQCVNNEGSYSCRRLTSCGTGYTLDEASQTCIDIDECRLKTHNCGAGYQCRNLPGSFRCTAQQCPLGYRLNQQTGTCDPITCARGMKPDSEGTCVDINECQDRANVCRPDQECQNTIGSFRCRNLLSCGPGFELNELANRCEDIDECSRGTHDCTGALMHCTNRPGTYMCTCPEGYQINHTTRTCEDLDECASLYGGSVCDLNAKCDNTPGSYRCICNKGFLNDGRYCVDVDECSQTGTCQHICRNTRGSYQCSCYEGYTLSEDGRSCKDIDECVQYSRAPLCLGECQNTQGSYQCSCPNGYRMLNDQRTCQDIDECVERTANCYGDDQQCINVFGTYKCEEARCPKGFVKAPSLTRNSNSIRCQRQTFVCPQGDTECLYAPLSVSYNFITFPSKIVIPADLFTMRGPRSVHRRLDFKLDLISAEDPYTHEARAVRADFDLVNLDPFEVLIRMNKQIKGPQDIELKLTMSIYSKEYTDDEEIFFGTAIAVIKIFVTQDLY